MATTGGGLQGRQSEGTWAIVLETPAYDVFSCGGSAALLGVVCPSIPE